MFVPVVCRHPFSVESPAPRHANSIIVIVIVIDNENTFIVTQFSCELWAMYPAHSSTPHHTLHTVTPPREFMNTCIVSLCRCCFIYHGNSAQTIWLHTASLKTQNFLSYSNSVERHKDQQNGRTSAHPVLQCSETKSKSQRVSQTKRTLMWMSINLN